METFKSFEKVLYEVNDHTFNEIALQLFHFQAAQNTVYRDYLSHLRVDIQSIRHFSQIPFLPISFFKTHTVKTGDWQEERIFSSSGTTGSATSVHLVHQLSFYLQNSERVFSQFFGSPDQYHIFALLPSYLEREGSSLIAMMDHLIRASKSEYSGFYLYNHEELINKIVALRDSDRRPMLWGVSFALLDLAERFDVDLRHCIILETGGMKGRRKELTREELQGFLQQRFHTHVGSEYGMTELMSQAYAMKGTQFVCPPWMKILLRNPDDPLGFEHEPDRGEINIIDLANIHSCAFIETCDLGKKTQNGSFEVIGRLDNSDIRGCNLLVE